MADIQFDYFTAAETEQYTFYRIPKALFTESHFQALSCEAKVLYGMMLDRLGLSIRNQWFDSQGRAYIIFTVEDVMGVMGCQSQKAVRLMKELDTADGIGLIEKKRIGLGRPNRIYVKNFMARGNGSGGAGTGIVRRIQPDTADIPCSPVSSSEKETNPQGQPGFAGTIPKMKADAENTTADIMPRTNAGTRWEENCTYEEDWRDMEIEAFSGTEMPGYGMPLCGSTTGTGMGFESTVGIMDNVDKCHTAGNFMNEYQNSGQDACFSLEMKALEKGGDFQNDRMQPENAAWDGLQSPYSAGDSSKTHDQEPVFVDKTVEAMVREMWEKRKMKQHRSSKECSRGLGDDAGQPCQGSQMQGVERRDSVILETETPEQRDSKRNDTEYSKTEYNKTKNNKTDFSDACTCYQSYQSYQPHLSRQYAQGGRYPDTGMDGAANNIDVYRECIRENIDYQCFRPQDMESVDELVELLADTMLVPDNGTVRVAGMEKPASVVKGRFMKLVHPHIEYVIDCMQKHTGKIRNIKAYLLTALYNSSLTMNSFYRAEVNHDLYGYC